MRLATFASACHAANPMINVGEAGGWGGVRGWGPGWG